VIATLRNNIAELDRRIGEVVATHPETSLFDSLPGAGKALVPRLIVAFGTRRERFASAAEMQRYSGIAPVTKASGNSRQVFFRRACPKFLRQTFHEFALHSIGQSEWAKAYYLHLQNDEKKGHHAAVRSLAYKWIRIIYRCWKDGKPYDEQIYLQSLSRRGSLLGGALAAATSVGWKSVAGFQKLSQNNA
jgi:transposase